MQPRMKNPAAVIPDAMKAIQALQAAAEKGDVPPKTLALAHLRASQINGCSCCIDGGARLAKKGGASPTNGSLRSQRGGTRHTSPMRSGQLSRSPRPSRG